MDGHVCEVHHLVVHLAAFVGVVLRAEASEALAVRVHLKGAVAEDEHVNA